MVYRVKICLDIHVQYSCMLPAFVIACYLFPFSCQTRPPPNAHPLIRFTIKFTIAPRLVQAGTLSWETLAYYRVRGLISLLCISAIFLLQFLPVLRQPRILLRTSAICIVISDIRLHRLVIFYFKFIHQRFPNFRQLGGLPRPLAIFLC